MSIERAFHLSSRISENLRFLNGRPVSIDIDAVTQATYKPALVWASHRLGRLVLKEELTDYWKLKEMAMDILKISEHEALDFAKEAWNRDEVYLNSPVMPGIKSLLNIFNEISTSYFFVSARSYKFKKPTGQWYGEELPWIKDEDIVVGRKKGEKGGEFKCRTINKRNAGLHIEDAPEEAIVVAEDTDAYVLVVPQPWNLQPKIQEEIDHPRIKHLKGYSNNTDRDGSWPVLRFLASKEAGAFLK